MRNTIDRSKCIKCHMCEMACPEGLIAVDDAGASFVPGADEACIACGHCVAACPKGIISVEGLPPEMFPAFSDERASAEQLQALMDCRRSVRVFKDNPVEDAAIERILRAVSTVPVGGGGAPPPVTVINGRQRLEPLVAPMMEFYRGFYKGMTSPFGRPIMRLVLGRDKYVAMKKFLPILKAMIEYYDETGSDCLMWGAPALLLFHTRPDCIGADYDPMIECTYAMLAAHAEGLGTTMIGMVPPFLNKNREWRRRLGIPDDHEVKISLIAGYPAMGFARGIRRKFDVNWVR